ncbi:MAG: VWA domain-containing protein [Lentisphaerae bacterium]|jgi:Ca-activated chloride channel family protein|nr:VWA domain-containing protein [Lentisphaerota bacterium]
MKWAAPHLLYWALLALPIAWAAHTLLRRRRRALDRLFAPANRADMAPGWLPARAGARLALRLAALLLAFLALARPQYGFHWEEVRQQGLDILVVFDTSRSMTASDIKPSRLQQAKWGVRDLVRNLRGDRIGLIPFAGASILQCPLTSDYAAFTMTLDDLYAGIIPRGGTAIEQALETAINSFPPDSPADRVILLITDGEDHEGNPLNLLPRLKEHDIRLYAIGIGTLEGGMIPDAQGGGYFKDRQGQIVKSSLREPTLQQLALATGGTYVRSAPGDTGLERVFHESISQLKRDELETRTAKIHEERFVWLLAAALILLAAEALLTERRPPTQPATS